MDPARPTSFSNSSASTVDAESAAAANISADSVSSRIGHFRWVICALLLFGTTKNYMDRQVLGVLKDTLQHDFGWNEIDYGNLVSAFQIAYAAGMLLVGRLVDELGTRLGYALAMIFWSLASMGTALANSLSSFALSRFALGFGEAAVFPASIKAVAEWFPKERTRSRHWNFQRRHKRRRHRHATHRALDCFALGMARRLHRHWRTRFRLARLLAPDLSQSARASKGLQSGNGLHLQRSVTEPTGKITWARLVPLRQTWAFVAGKFLTDPVWWFYLFWVPGFLQAKHGLALTGLGVPDSW